MKKEEALLVSEPEAAIANHKASFFPPVPRSMIHGRERHLLVRGPRKQAFSVNN